MLINKIKNVFNRPMLISSIENKIRKNKAKILKIEEDINMGIASDKSIIKHKKLVEEIIKMGELALENGKLVQKNTGNEVQQKSTPEFIANKVDNSKPQQPKLSREEFEEMMKRQAEVDNNFMQQAQQQAPNIDQERMQMMQAQQQQAQMQAQQQAQMQAQQQAQQQVQQNAGVADLEIYTPVNKYLISNIPFEELDDVEAALVDAINNNKIFKIGSQGYNGRHIIQYKILIK